MRTLPVALLLSACQPAMVPSVGDDGVALQRIRTGTGVGSTYVSLDVLVTDQDGEPVDCEDTGLNLALRVKWPGQDFAAIDPTRILSACRVSAVAPDIALVLDNSGSQVHALDETRTGATTLVEQVLAAGGRASVTRVSTHSEVLAPLTDDGNTLDNALQRMFVNRGWTSLYDGLRLGNETLAGVTPPAPAYADLQDFCDADVPFGIVAFSNGIDNNSSEQMLDGGDGIDTSMDDVAGLGVDSITTPIHTIGLGRDLDTASLRELSRVTGGTHIALTDDALIPEAFDLVQRWMGATRHVCAQPPTDTCGTTILEVSYDVRAGCNQGIGNGSEGCDPGNSNQGDPANSNDEPTGNGPGNGNNNAGGNGNAGNNGNAGGNGNGQRVRVTREIEVHVPCAPGDGAGRVATVLLDLSDDSVAPAAGAELARSLVGWVTPVMAPRVLVVEDDRNVGGDAGDVDRITQWLVDAGMDVTQIDEPHQGLSLDDVDTYDVVWFSNPGRPMDDAATAAVLTWFAHEGKGVVLQGDDMSAPMGRSFDLSHLTGLTPLTTGDTTCDLRTDDGGDAPFQVAFDAAHPALGALSGQGFAYANDIDHTVPVQAGEQVLGWATVDTAAGCATEVPVVVVRQL